MSLLSAIANRKSVRHQDAVKRYAAILKKNDDADADELITVMEVLGKTEANVAADLATLRNFENLQARYAKRIQLGDAYLKAKTDLDRYTAELAAFKAGGGYDPQRETAGLDNMHLRFNEAQGRFHFACGALDHMVRLQAEHPELLGGKTLPK